jgi:hypothetical protein
MNQQNCIQMSASLINLSILSSSGFLHQINPSSINNSSNLMATSGAFLKRRQMTLGSSFFGLQDNATANVED